jgi:outer membrane protein TolC
MKRLFLLLLSFVTSFGQAQTTQQVVNLSLDAAVQYALAHSPEVQNRILGEKYADEQVNETRAIGIPQLTANMQFINNIEKQVFVFPVAPGVYQPIRVGNKYSTTGTLAASWLAVDASYFFGLRAAKAFTDLAKLQTNLSSRDVTVNVTKAYYLVLITKENITLLEQNMITLDAVLTQTEGFYKNGFAEKLDVDRLKLTISNLSVQLDALRDQAIVTEQLLKSQMGMPIENPIALTDNLESLNKVSINQIGNAFDVKLRVEYQLLQSQWTLHQLDKKRFEVTRYPNLAFFYNYQQNNFSETVDYGKWYGNSFWGFRIGVPLFTGFNTNAQINKRKLSMLQTENSMTMFESAAALEVSQTRIKYQRSLNTIEIQKKNLQLANEILAISSAKLKEGVGSNLEITNAQQEVKTSQTNYLNAIYDLLNAQIDLKKAYGKF